MAKFRDYLEGDLKTFLNLDEFGEVHTLDGQELAMIVEDDMYNGRPKQPADLYNNANGVYTVSTTIFVRSVDYERPEVGQIVELDRTEYNAEAVSEIDGMLKIQLIAYVS